MRQGPLAGDGRAGRPALGPGPCGPPGVPGRDGAYSATCLDRRWEPGDLGSSGAEWGGFARDSAAVACGCSGSRTAPRPALLTR
jgi:hypothetical protein